jgi:hypothetical protein
LVDVGGSEVEVFVCRPAIAVRDSLDEAAVKVLSTVEPTDLVTGQELAITVDGTQYNLKEGTDFWRSSSAKVRAVQAVDWFK